MRHTWFAYVMLICIAGSSLCLGQSRKQMNNQDVIDMVSLGLSDDLVIDKIRSSEGPEFDTSVAGLKALKAAKVSDSVIRSMISPHPAASSTSPPVAGPSTTNNPLDPNAPHDPGIYMYAKGREGIQMTMLEPTVYSQGKSGGLFKSAMTYGIAKMKWKAVVRGGHSSVRSSDAGMVFYFYFEESNAGLSHASFGGTTTPNQFTLLKFDVKGDTRETVVMKANAFGASSGTDEKASTSFAFTKLRPGVYKVVPNAALKPGEYCFLSGEGIGAYGAGAAGASRLFDFSVLPAE